MTHDIIAGEVVGNSGDGFFSNTSFQDFGTSLLNLKKNYGRKSVVSINSLFYPYSCDPSGSVTYSGIYQSGEFNMPHFLIPDSGSETPNVNDLHPFNSGHDIGFTTFDSGVPEDINPIVGGYPPKEQYRGIALRGPLVITGPCYDINGDPYPAPPSGEQGSPINSGFADNYMNRSDLWATGPLDVRFDPDRGVYVAGSTGGTKLVSIVLPTGDFKPLVSQHGNQYSDGDSVTPPTVFRGVNYNAQEYKLVQADNVGDLSTFQKVGNPFIVTNYKNNIILENQLYIATKINGGWVISNNNQFEGFDV